MINQKITITHLLGLTTQLSKASATICCQSLENGGKISEVTDKYTSNLAGRALFAHIKAIGTDFTDRAACTLAIQLVKSKIHTTDTVKTFYERHTGILKKLRGRDMSDTEILDLIEKTMFNEGLPDSDSQFAVMKEISALDKDITLEMLFEQAKNVQDLDSNVLPMSILQEAPGFTRQQALKTKTFVTMS